MSIEQPMHAQDVPDLITSPEHDAPGGTRAAIRIRNLAKEFTELAEIEYLSVGEAWFHIRQIFRHGSVGGSSSGLRIAKGRLSIPALDIQPGSVVCLTGPTGSGKSVLLQILANLTPMSDGRVELCGNAALVNGANVDRRLTMRENVEEAFRYNTWRPENLDATYNRIVQFAELKSFKHLKVGEFSSGMVLRFSVALSLETDPDIWLIDDILGVADLKFQVKCKEQLRRMRHSGRTILFASHDDALITEMADRVIMLHEGRIVFDGTPRELEIMREKAPKDYRWRVATRLSGNEALTLTKVDSELLADQPILRLSIECDLQCDQKLEFGAEIRHGEVAFLKVDLATAVEARRGRNAFQVDVPLEVLNAHIHTIDLTVTSEASGRLYSLKLRDFITLDVRQGPFVRRHQAEASMFAFDLPLAMQACDGTANP